MTQTGTPLTRLASWLGRRQDQWRPCGLNRRNGAANMGLCEMPITLRQSDAAGHRGFCSHEHAREDQENQLL